MMSDAKESPLTPIAEWQFVTDSEVKHHSGFVLVLAEGSWRNPMDIRPRVAGNQSAVEVSQLIRKGLAFASYAPPPKHFSSAPPQSRKTPSRPVLSLKKSSPNKTPETA